MGNYKPYGHSQTIITPFLQPLPSGAIPVTLTNMDLLDVTATSMHKADGATDYVVPAGKKYVLLSISIITDIVTRQFTIFQSDAADVATNPVTKFSVKIFSPAVQYSHEVIYYIPDGISIAASKYINVKVNNITSAGFPNLIYGYEIDI